MSEKPSAAQAPLPLITAGDEAWRRALVAALERAPDPALAVTGFERLIEAGSEKVLAAWPAAELDALACILGSSPALTRWLTRFGADWPNAARIYEEANPGRDALIASLAVEPNASFEDLCARLRTVARREMYRIGARDLLGLAPLDDTVSALTDLAEASLETAVRHVRAQVARAAGSDVADESGRPIGFVVLGLGKLGGRELNYSSDVDIVFLFDNVRPSEGGLDPAEFFARVAADVTRAIGEPTSDGLVFRVDLRLRPEGDAGPLVNSVNAALSYYEGWGDTWERGALAKARPVAGDVEVGARFCEGITPFVYRRHLDFQTVEDLRRMKERIDAEQSVQAPGIRDVKLGRGGIRELEFVVQALQLIHGGHEPAVRATGTRAALEALRRHQMIAENEAQQLARAYTFLRDVEHAIQVVEQRQTQRLPADPSGLRALARRLGYGTGRRGRPADVADEIAAFEADWQRHTSSIREAFVRVLELRPGETRPDEARRDAAVNAILGRLERGDTDGAARLLAQMGFPEPTRAAETLLRLYRGRIAAPASPQRRRAVEAMAPSLLHAVADSADPQTALDRLVDFLIRTGAHTSYLALLGGSPATMQLLVDVFAASPFLAGLLVGHPELLDSLVRSDLGATTRDEALLAAELTDALAAAGDDEEAVLAALRTFRNAELLRIGMQDLAGVLDAEQVQRQLTLLAEVCLRAAADRAHQLVRARHPAGHQVELAIVALGKMGGGEMTYASDLDLLFVYRGDVPGFDADAHGFATRWVQKTISLLQTRTRDGIVYAIDARLRPSGRSGPLVTSFERYADYHRTEAELWERQAHVRARVVYGPADLRRDVESVIADVVYGRGLKPSDVVEIDAMRKRIETELGAESAGKRNIKTGRGGIVDIEFLVQMLQLRHGAEVPAVRVAGTLPALRALRDTGLLDAHEAGRLIEHYLCLRRLEARMRLERDRPVEAITGDVRALAPLARRLGFAGEDPGRRLLTTYERTCEEVRRIYERHFARIDV